ncbi:MAG: hypothetical protein ACXVO9_07260 [Bacteroidia bacterium]
MNKARQIFPILLLIAFSAVIFNYLFFTGFIKIQKQDLRALSFKDLKIETIKISANDLYKSKNGVEWHENNSELSVDGNYFEVVEVTSIGADIIIKVVKDEKENKLFGSFFTSQKKNSDILFNLVKLFFNLNLNAVPVQSPLNVVTSVASKISIFSDIWSDPNYYFKKIKPPQFTA